MEIDSITERKLQKLISKYTNGDKDFLTQFSILSKKEKEQFHYLLTITYIFTNASKFRGKVINAMIFFEMILAESISKYFVESGKKQTILNSFVFDRMQLSSKFNLFKKILKVHHREIWEKYKSEIMEIGSLIDFRNNLAHSMLDSSPEYIDLTIKKTNEHIKNKTTDSIAEEIQVSYYKDDDFINEIITQEQVDEFYEKCVQKTVLIQKIAKEIS